MSKAEDAADIKAANKALKEAKAKGTIPWAKVKKLSIPLKDLKLK